jgi:uncharacterized protein (DUF433 family)
MLQIRERIIVDPKIQHGKPIIRGTRVPVARIIGSLAGGMTRDEVIKEYGIIPEDIDAALAYAAELIDEDQYRPLSVG